MEQVGGMVSKVMDYKPFGKDMKVVLLVCAVLFAVLVGSGYVAFKKTGGVTPFVEMVKGSGGNPKAIYEAMQNKKGEGGDNNALMAGLKL